MGKVAPKEQPGMVKDTSQYGSYLVNESCGQMGCDESVFLVYPEANACHCGHKKAHIHCRNCGGIASAG